LVNRNGVSIHHVANPAPFHAVAFIFDERAASMVNRWYAPIAPRLMEAFSSEVDPGSRQENASKQKSRARF
jgi:hypothetical protein